MPHAAHAAILQELTALVGSMFERMDEEQTDGGSVQVTLPQMTGRSL